MKNIENKVVIITGASSGIGAETARVLAKNGAKVVLSARREERLKKLVEEIGENAVYLKSDVSNAEDMQALVKLAKEKFGKVDALFANAGIMPGGNMSELKVKDWMGMVNINIVGVLNSMAAVLPEFDRAEKRTHHCNFFSGRAQVCSRKRSLLRHQTLCAGYAGFLPYGGGNRRYEYPRHYHLSRSR